MPPKVKNDYKKRKWNGGRNERHHDKEKSSRKPEYRHQDQLTETDVGITQYISNLEGYSAVIKSRFSDFQVNEINADGKLAKLTDITPPESFASHVHKYSYEETKDSPSEKISQEIWESLRNMVGGSDAGSNPIEIEANNLSKEERKSIYDCVKSYFGQEIIASTISKDNKTVLQFRKASAKNKDNRVQWPANTSEYVYFLLYKEMMDTMDACFRISQALRIPPTKITYAGVKDRRAKTTQWFCIRKYEPSKIASAVQRTRNLHVGNFEFKENLLKLGQLRGNKFRIALRNVIADDDLIGKSILHVKEHGFINYYGLQRFGNDKETPTFLIGVKLLKGQWKEAVDLILKVKAADDLSLDIHRAKHVYSETKDAKAALKLLHRNKSNVEKKLLEGLAKHHGNDYVNALENIPRSIRLMYIHSFQSFIWNKVASKRIKDFGLVPIEGDLILVDEVEEQEMLEERGICESEKSEQEPSDDNDDKPKKLTVRALKANELDKYSIFDIVLPLPGYDVTYPETVKEYYKEVIEECGLTLEMPMQKVKTYSLNGTYRKLVQLPADVTWKIMHYNDPTDNLILSDLEELNGVEEPKNIDDGKYKAVIVVFTLNPSSYATMVLREILKCNTSSSSQASLNDYGENKLKVNPSISSENGYGKIEIAMDEVQEGSLLADEAKYEVFKNSVFKDVLGCKRELSTEEDQNGAKKMKTNENENV